MADLIRTLFIGLGGTGGNVLQHLYNRMSDEEQKTANYVFVDTDQKDIDRMELRGIRCIPISNADRVIQVASQLGQDDGVTDWLPNGSGERVFLDSRIDDGAGQCRFKSRLCFARFLKNDAPGLKELLEEMCISGLTLEDRARVVIVSSIAGGTGAGTFIQMALYIRKFFRKLNQKAEVIGIFSCPDLYTDYAKNEMEKVSMFANAYAAIRELNAMNLATNHPEAQHLQGYGMNIDLKLDTRSEGRLFDSKIPEFKDNVGAKPFDLIYFVDKANEQGGILRDIHEYYRIMANVAYTRLYSPLNQAIASGESNELHSHTKVPTAIYGSAGYAKIIYPYNDIVRYLTEKKLYDELGDQWLYFDALWDAEYQMELDAARAYGGQWSPKKDQRGKKFIGDMDAEMRDERSRFLFLKNMIQDKGGRPRVLSFTSKIKKAASSLGAGTDAGGNVQLPDGQAALQNSGGKFSVLRDPEVVRLLSKLSKLTKYQSAEDQSDGDNAFSGLLSKSAEAENNWREFASALENAVKSQSQKLFSAILPLSEVAVSNHDKLSPISLHYALLSKENSGEIHPLAARYLLYGFQEICTAQGAEDKNAFRASLDQCLRKIRLALDDDLDDDQDITIPMVVEQLNRKWTLGRRRKLSIADELMETFCNELKANLAQALIVADNAVVSGAYNKLREPVGELISLYEGFFRNITPYRDKLNQRVYADLIRHDGSGNQTIFVGASSSVKRIYSVEPAVVGALNSDPDATHAAAGAGVFENLFQRLQKRMKENELARNLGDSARQEDKKEEKFDDMDRIFDSILQRYEHLLTKDGSLLQTNAVGALINEICAELGLTRGDIGSKAENRQRFERAFRERLQNLVAKARPMIRYNETNSQNYFLEEIENKELNVSKLYCQFGFSPAAAAEIQQLFKAPPVGSNDSNSPAEPDSTELFAGFRRVMRMGKNEGLQVHESFHDNEIFCFCAVHCLQPTQIYHFLENQSEDSYFPDYRARITSRTDSDNPHLDKRWTLRGTMPYISANLELQWRKIVLKALIYEVLKGKIGFTVDRNRNRFFVREEKGTLKYLRSITTRQLSRLVEYLSTNEELLELEAQKLDEMVERRAAHVYERSADDPQEYKKQMTIDKLLTLLRSNMIEFLDTGTSLRPDKQAEESDGEEDVKETIVDLKGSLGGILHIAYLLHSNEEQVNRDKDYGEGLLTVAADIIDQFTLKMISEAELGSGSTHSVLYVEIYNWAAQKFYEDWLEWAEAEHESKRKPNNQDPEEKSKKGKGRLDELDTPIQSTKRKLKEPSDTVRQLPEYIWIMDNWKYKDPPEE